MNQTDKIASRFLGKRIDGVQNYDPSFLVAVPREENRKQYSIDSRKLPFEGVDVWHAYEFSCMTENGLPVTRLMKMKYSCQSEFIIESKSLKLYLNSFNMSRFGKNIKECLAICKEKIESDLTKKLASVVSINFLDDTVEKVPIFSGYKNVLTCIDESNLQIENFKEAPELLQIDINKISNKYYLSFDSLRSNCRVTHQPDFGDVFIYYNSKKHILEDSLLKYLCSFRSEYHFHEECCEMIFKRLYDLLDDGDELLVAILYTRRGGIDICPARWSKNIEAKDVLDLLNLSKFARNSIKQ